MNKKQIELKFETILIQLSLISFTIRTSSLTMEGIVVPPYVLKGEAAELRCLFRLDRDNLYSVTWYKDHEEFYRYVPGNNPKQHTYELEGATIDQGRSGVDRVTLDAANPAASGLYRCEVSAEKPSFTSVNAEGRMDVVSLPEKEPEITRDVYSNYYNDDDTLSFNCSAAKSYPPATIQWFVNDKKVPAWFEIQGSMDRSTISGLQISRNNFTERDLRVRCIATVGSSPPPLDTRGTELWVRASGNIIESSAFKLLLLIVYILLRSIRK